MPLADAAEAASAAVPITVAMASKSLDCLTGFVRYASTPASLASSASLPRPAELATTSFVGEMEGSPFILLASSIPSIPGICTSRIARS